MVDWWKDLAEDTAAGSATVDAIRAVNPGFAHWLGFLGSASPSPWQNDRQRAVIKAVAGIFELGRRICPEDFPVNEPLSRLHWLELDCVFSVTHPTHGTWREWGDYLILQDPAASDGTPAPAEPMLVWDERTRPRNDPDFYTEWLRLKHPSCDSTITVAFSRAGASRHRIARAMRDQFQLHGALNAPTFREIATLLKRIEQHCGVKFRAQAASKGDVRRSSVWVTIKSLEEMSVLPAKEVKSASMRQAKHRAARLWAGARPHVLGAWRDELLAVHRSLTHRWDNK